MLKGTHVNCHIAAAGSTALKPSLDVGDCLSVGMRSRPAPEGAHAEFETYLRVLRLCVSKSGVRMLPSAGRVESSLSCLDGRPGVRVFLGAGFPARYSAGCGVSVEQRRGLRVRDIRSGQIYNNLMAPSQSPANASRASQK